MENTSHINSVVTENKESPYAHFSFDDTSYILKDLTDNAATYSSIFDQPELAFLRDMHIKYGAVFSLYLFYNHNGFSLDNMTSKFLDEFSRNAHWLKFGFHSDSVKNYNNTLPEELLADYTKMINRIILFASGSTIDTIPRFHNFGANMESQLLLKDNNIPYDGMLGADDKIGRASCRERV